MSKSVYINFVSQGNNRRRQVFAVSSKWLLHIYCVQYHVFTPHDIPLLKSRKSMQSTQTHPVSALPRTWGRFALWMLNIGYPLLVVSRSGSNRFTFRTSDRRSAHGMDTTLPIPQTLIQHFESVFILAYLNYILMLPRKIFALRAKKSPRKKSTSERKFTTLELHFRELCCENRAQREKKTQYLLFY